MTPGRSRKGHKKAHSREREGGGENMDDRYSELYKRIIHGDDCCPFWSADQGGNCNGWPGKDNHPCQANRDGSECPLFPTAKQE